VRESLVLALGNGDAEDGRPCGLEPPFRAAQFDFRLDAA
jgi:hypothetical protein